jgi:hypothetical protein
MGLHYATLRYATLRYTVLYCTMLCYNSLPRKSIAKMIKTEKSRDTTNPMNDCCSLSVFNIFCLSCSTSLMYSSISLLSNCVWVPLFPSILHYIFHLISSYFGYKVESLLKSALNSLSQFGIHRNRN